VTGHEKARRRWNEWETTGDRITRRKRIRKSRPADWTWEYRIQRDIDGELFTAMVDLLPEIIETAPLDILNQIIRDGFAGCLADAIQKRDGDWITSK
jgi:hypothetical protein